MSRDWATYRARAVEPRRRLLVDLVAVLVQKIRREWERDRREALATDMGYDDCPVCLANRWIER